MNKNLLATYDQISSIFHLSKGAIISHYKRGLEIKECGRENSLNDEKINNIIDKCPETYDMILSFLQYQFGITFLIKTRYKIIKKNLQL